MKAVIVCVSVSHGNTRRIAEAMGEVLGARVVGPEELDTAELASCDLVGFGSGIFTMNFHPRLRELIRALPAQSGTKAFVYATSGMPETPLRRYTRSLATLLTQRGFTVLDTFTCRGLDTWLPMRSSAESARDIPTPPTSTRHAPSPKGCATASPPGAESATFARAHAAAGMHPPRGVRASARGPAVQ